MTLVMQEALEKKEPPPFAADGAFLSRRRADRGADAGGSATDQGGDCAKRAHDATMIPKQSRNGQN